MKKFRFTLQTLKDYRERLLDSEKNTLGIMRGELAELENDLREILAVIAAKNKELTERMSEGVSPQEISMIKRFIAAKQQELVAKRNQIAKKERDIEKQLGIVIEKTQDVSILEKLEESQLEEYRALELKESEQFIEEFVSNADFRKSRS